MKKVFGILSVSFFLVALMTSLAMAQAKPIEWKMISTWTPAINLIEADRYFVKMVNEMSGGRFKITLHPAPELVPPNQVFDAISKGSFPIGGEWPNYWQGKTRFLTSLVPTPWGFASMTM
jgi:TRAP-type mannitol/chloroaromatic compound transport system substrate-binding protein